jgi:hypothetical protein
MHTLCILLDDRVTPSGHGPVMAITNRQSATIRTLGQHHPDATLIWKRDLKIDEYLFNKYLYLFYFYF